MVHHPSTQPFPAASLPLKQSLDKALLPQMAMMPTMLPTLHQLEDAGSTPTMNNDVSKPMVIGIY
jgi:hypothetical protein